MSDHHAVILSLGRERSMGTARRQTSWEEIFAGVGMTTEQIPVLKDHPIGPNLHSLPSIGAPLRFRAVPETMAWSVRSLADRLRDLRPEVLVCTTARTFHPDLLETSPHVVLDYVDRLSVSYELRAEITRRTRERLQFLALAAAARRFEAQRWPSSVRAVAAGLVDARALGADWVPITMPVGEPVDATTADHDLLFFGNLSYPPNVAGVERLQRLWPALVQDRPGTTVLIAGAYPSPKVEAAVEACGWTLEPFFKDLPTLLARARLAVVPLDHATGIQNKMLDAACYALPQLVTPAVMAGVDDEFPVRVARDDAEFVAAAIELLDDPAAAQALGQRSRDHIAARYSAAHWAGWALGLLRS